MIHVYCDGGVIERNPSPIGGTWAWVAVSCGRKVDDDSGLIIPGQTKLLPKGDPIVELGHKITNNFMELFAAWQALNRPCVLWTDSEVTKHRLTAGRSFAGIPQWLRLKILDLRRTGLWTVELVAGHATKAELEAGISKRGHPTSKWNSWCDARCRLEAETYLKKLRQEKDLGVKRRRG
jgi:ribonuclease HI